MVSKSYLKWILSLPNTQGNEKIQRFLDANRKKEVDGLGANRKKEGVGLCTWDNEPNIATPKQLCLLLIRVQAFQ